MLWVVCGYLTLMLGNLLGLGPVLFVAASFYCADWRVYGVYGEVHEKAGPWYMELRCGV